MAWIETFIQTNQNMGWEGLECVPSMYLFYFIEKVLHGIVLEHRIIWIVSLYLF